jgi:hypothetical protein
LEFFLLDLGETGEAFVNLQKLEGFGQFSQRKCAERNLYIDSFESSPLKEMKQKEY